MMNTSFLCIFVFNFSGAEPGMPENGRRAGRGLLPADASGTDRDAFGTGSGRG